METFKFIVILIMIILLGINVARLFISGIFIIFTSKSNGVRLSKVQIIINMVEVILITIGYVILVINYY